MSLNDQWNTSNLLLKIQIMRFLEWIRKNPFRRIVGVIKSDSLTAEQTTNPTKQI